MDYEKENDLTTYLFATSSVALVLTMHFGKGEYDQLALLAYTFSPALFFFVYQLIKITQLKKILKTADKKLLKKISKKGGNINAIAIFNNAEVFENLKNEKVTSKYRLAKKAINFSFFSVLVLIIAAAISIYGRA